MCFLVYYLLFCLLYYDDSLNLNNIFFLLSKTYISLFIVCFRSSELSPQEVYCLAYYLSRVEFHCDESNSSIVDSNFLATLWLMTLQLPAVEFSEYLDMDSKTWSLLALANIVTRVNEDNPVLEQVRTCNST